MKNGPGKQSTKTPPFDIARGERESETAEIERLRGLSERERSDMIKAVCRAAAVIHSGRLKSGLPPATPDPWPASTWEFMRRQGAHANRT